MMTTIFGKIIRGEASAKKVFENDRIIVIHDINPSAPVHLLIIPKKEIPNLQSIAEDDLPLMAEVIDVATKMAKKFGVEEGYRLLTNNGSDAGQQVFHLHFHLIGGKKLGPIA
jgi:histidine triad (HIT) family protein